MLVQLQLDSLEFPPPHKTNSSGVLAMGGDLRPERLILAYQQGIFPWFSEDSPIYWWCPNPRFVLFPAQLKVSSSMKQVLRSQKFRVTADQDFRQVITNCRQKMRPGQQGTWITDELLEAYCTLHQQGYAHSVEVWEGPKLVGGLYGVILGQCFFGESMFAHVSNASKVGFITLVQHLQSLGFVLIDCQVYTEHLDSLGAKMITRKDFLQLLSLHVDVAPFDLAAGFVNRPTNGLPF